MSRYWNADSDLDYYLGNAPPEEAPQEREEEPVDEEEMDEAVAVIRRMMDAIDAAIPGYDGKAMLLRQRLREICLDYGDARGALAMKNCNAIWGRK